MHEDKKTIIRKCDECDLKFEAPNILECIKQIQLHKVTDCVLKKANIDVNGFSCDQCDYVSNNETHLKKHGRDDHGKLDISTSPAPKKRKEDANVSEVENMDIIESILSECLEKMEVDTMSATKKMDDKVIEKRKHMDEDKSSYYKNKQERERLKVIEEEVNRKAEKKSKQIDKKKQKKEVKPMEDTNLPSYLKKVPDLCKPLVGQDSVVLKVPGNGLCGPGSAAAHLFQDYNFAQLLRRAMNVHVLENHEFYKDKGYLCDDENPFEREVKDEAPVKFTDPNDLFAFLMSPSSDYMYSDSEDFLIIANMYNMKVKIVRDENPASITEILPDKDMKHTKVVDDEVVSPDMTIIYESGNHFNLVVSRQSDLATLGTITHRDHGKKIPVAMKANSKQTKPNQTSFKDIEENKSLPLNEENVELKAKVESLIQFNEAITQQYRLAIIEMKTLKENLEYLKIENKNLKYFVDNNQTTGPSDKKSDTAEATKEKSDEETIKSRTCKECSYICTSNSHLNIHMKRHQDLSVRCRICKIPFKSDTELIKHKKKEHERKSPEYNCMDCDFQSSSRGEFTNHRQQKHTPSSEITVVIKCRNCDTTFQTKWQLMNHRRDIHPSNRMCKYYAENKCKFTTQGCWYKHEAPLSSNRFKCFTCDQEFENLNNLMMHKKHDHVENCNNCSKFVEGICQLTDDRCWFIHNVNEEEDFQEVQGNLPPPINPQ